MNFGLKLISFIFIILLLYPLGVCIYKNIELNGIFFYYFNCLLWDMHDSPPCIYYYNFKKLCALLAVI